MTFLLFGGNNFSPRGGPGDFLSSHKSYEEAEEAGDIFLAGGGIPWAIIASWDGAVLKSVSEAEYNDGVYDWRQM